MIKTFTNKETAAVFAGEHPRRLPLNVLSVAIRKIAQLDAVQSVHELLVIDWKNSVVLGKGNIVYVSTINGGYVSGLLKVMFMMLKWLITIKGA